MAKVRVAAVLAALETLESQDQQPHTDPEEAGQENVSKCREEVPGEVVLCEAAGPSRLMVMRNPILMDNIANYLSAKDLVALCLTSKTTKRIVDWMDSSCWGKRARKLGALLKIEATDLTSTTYKERYLFLRAEVERHAKLMKRYHHFHVVSYQDGQSLGTDDILALVRAMKTRVQCVIFYQGTTDARALLKSYDGNGRCEEVLVVVWKETSIEYESSQIPELRQLAGIIDWDVDVTMDNGVMYISSHRQES